MTQTAEWSSSPQDSGHLQPTETASAQRGHTSSLHSAPGSISDNDAGERPVREKLKKTSIASIPKHGVASARPDVEAPRDSEMGSQNPGTDLSMKEEPTDARVEDRGRPVRKRSLDDLDSPEAGDGATGDKTENKSSGHARKRSRDVRAGEALNLDGRRRGGSPEISVQEEDEGIHEAGHGDPNDEQVKPVAAPNTPPTNHNDVDEEMKESALSPRKKRSRDQFESETHREQKIAATDETKARRRSSEESREREPRTEVADSSTKDVSLQNGHIVPPEEASSESKSETLSKVSPTSGFANTSVVSPFGALAGSVPPLGIVSNSNKDTTNQHTQTSTSAFASSGFGALSGSVTSPFGQLGASSMSSIINPASNSKSLSSESPFGALGDPKSPNAPVGGFATASTGFGNAVVSGFGSSSTSGFGTIGSSVFGGGFAGGFGGGTKLTSFAASTGDAKLGTDRGNMKPFGSATKGDDEQEVNSDDEGGSGEEVEGQASEETDARFHHVEVDTGEEGEETLFHVQGKLFCFDGTNWVERGLGTFKLNKAQSVSEEHGDGSRATARFIMRAQQTHRVVLNTPVFKQMSIGDTKGNEPSGKTISFAAVENGKPVPYLLRLGKEDDVKSLYREVRQLQKIL